MKTSVYALTIYVVDQDSALEFYTQKLGFEVTSDTGTPDGFRWLTVAPPQSSVEWVLFPIDYFAATDKAATDAFRVAQRAGVVGPCILNVEDCRATHQELVARGVQFVAAPQEEFYGTQAQFLDDSGNVLTIVGPNLTTN